MLKYDHVTSVTQTNKQTSSFNVTIYTYNMGNMNKQTNNSQ